MIPEPNLYSRKEQKITPREYLALTILPTPSEGGVSKLIIASRDELKLKSKIASYDNTKLKKVNDKTLQIYK